MAVAPLPPESPSPKSVKSGYATVQPTVSSPKTPKEDNRVKLLSVGFNQDFGCFACATSNGFRIYNSEPFMETFRRDFKNGGIGLVEMLFRCNILALVGGGTNPRYMPNKVMIWDDHQSRCIGELSFRSEVRGVRLRRDRIIVILEHKIYVYNFSDLKLLQHIDTISNPKGLCVLSTVSNSSVVACPGLHRGQVRVEHYTLKKTKFIVAHDASLACLALTPDGRILATASTKGTLIRIFNTLDGTKLQELRRGTDKAEIYSISFASTAQWLAVSSDRGTVHIFSLNVHAAGEDIKSSDSLQSPVSQTYTIGNGTAVGSPTANSSPISFISGNPSSSLHFMKGVLPRYFSSEWSFAQFRLPDETRSIVAFGSQKNTVIIISLDGSFYTCSFDPIEGGEMVQCDYKRFVS